MTAAISSPATWQAGFLAVLPAIQTHAQIQFRKLPFQQRQERVQEAIASACCSYQRLAARNKLDVAHPGTLADYAVKDVRRGRHVGGHQDGARDCLSPRFQRRHGVKVFSYDEPAPRERDWKSLLIPARRHPIPDTVAFRIDFERWLKGLALRDRRIIRALIRGDCATLVARRFGLSNGVGSPSCAGITSRHGGSSRGKGMPGARCRALNSQSDVRGGRDTGTRTARLLFTELFPKAVDGRDNSSGLSFSIDEHDAVDQVLQFCTAVQFPPA